MAAMRGTPSILPLFFFFVSTRRFPAGHIRRAAAHAFCLHNRRHSLGQTQDGRTRCWRFHNNSSLFSLWQRQRLRVLGMCNGYSRAPGKVRSRSRAESDSLLRRQPTQRLGAWTNDTHVHTLLYLCAHIDIYTHT